MNKSVSVIISAYNEESNIEQAILTVLDVVAKIFQDYELLVFNDGSTDKTGPIVSRLAGLYPSIKVTHNTHNIGLANISRLGIQMATKTYLTWFPGTNSVDKKSFHDILSAAGETDIVIAYIENDHVRPHYRRFLSKSYTFLMNFLFRLNIRYFNGPTVYRTSLVKSVQTRALGHDFFAEMLIRCLKKNASYKQVAFEHKIGTVRKSKAISVRNLKGIVKTTACLFRDIYWGNLRSANH